MTEGIVTFDDWSKIDLRVAEILEVEEIEGADKLYKLKLNVGSELGERTIAAGIKPYYKIKELEGRKIIYFQNLNLRKIRGVESQGMLLAASSEGNEQVILLDPGAAEVGWRIG